ncbi:hypothetical protein AURDEDRAFT_131912 [Auricularia subglabra TFB-10046 SS5]|uniref:Uncharacterized protein n=1 Tax=Auricularia subglabra (strain TFB-10046 / SS5) TaxID=717982 RepID=J0WKZ9_AURST|nr:hypothetical protein AURDEDRAFT_131912 [Auricularia subglabra TFB-10046 SS5]
MAFTVSGVRTSDRLTPTGRFIAPTVPMKGRRRIHDDSKARKRAYYQRNAEKERERAKARQSSRNARRAKREAEAASAAASRSLLSRHLPCTSLVLGPTLRITRTALGKLFAALTEDLARWRSLDSDKEELEAVVSFLLDHCHAPVAHAVPVISQSRDIVSAVKIVASSAAALAWDAEPDRALMEGSLWSLLDELAESSSRLLVCLDEIIVLYNADPSQLQCRVAEQTLGMFTLF